MRAVGDHHVDRPQVQAGRPAQPSGPNRPTALRNRRARGHIHDARARGSARTGTDGRTNEQAPDPAAEGGAARARARPGGPVAIAGTAHPIPSRTRP